MHRLFMAALGATFIALGTLGTDPAQAALLNFSFTTESSGTGSFILNTDTVPTSESGLLTDDDGSVIGTGFVYPNAVSNFSFSSPDVNLSNLTGEFAVFPSNPPYFAPDSTGVDSGFEYPTGCTVATDFVCSVQVLTEYIGSISELPVLSDDPLSYPRAFAFQRINPTTSDFLTNDRITNFRVTPVPESDSVLGTLAFGIGGAGKLLKRKMNRKKAAIKP